MKRSPFLTSVIALAPGVVLVTGYALLSNPLPRQASAAFSHCVLSAGPGVTLSDDSRLAGSSPGAGGQAPGETRAFSGNAPSAGIGSGGIGSGTGTEYPGRSSRDSIATSGEDGSYRTQSGSAYGQSSSPSTGASPALQAPPSAPLPLVFRPLPPNVAATHPRLAAALQNLQQNFANAVGGPNQNPNDPAYAQRWLTAQEISDEQYRLLVGNQNYLMEQISINSGKQ